MNPLDRVLYLFRQADKSLVFRYSLIIILAGILRIMVEKPPVVL